jgi:hypothetical protein
MDRMPARMPTRRDVLRRAAIAELTGRRAAHYRTGADRLTKW